MDQENIIPEQQVKEAFQALMGMNGDRFFEEIANTGQLSQRSYDIIVDNISYNSQSSILEHFGLVHWFYLQSK